jgi:hypothetical protein
LGLLLLIMDVNRPQRGMIAVRVTPLERAAESSLLGASGPPELSQP